MIAHYTSLEDEMSRHSAQSQAQMSKGGVKLALEQLANEDSALMEAVTELERAGEAYKAHQEQRDKIVAALSALGVDERGEPL